MKIRTLYFKVQDIQASCNFWQTLLQIAPHKKSDNWCEFMCGTMRLGILLNDFGDVCQGSGCVPVFEFEDAILAGFIERARDLGATELVNGLDDPNLKSIVFRDPFGHEFELSRFHDA